MPTSTLKARAADRIGLDPDATFRNDFLRAVSRIGLGRDQAATLVEASSGHPFSHCGATELLPVLVDLLALAQRATGADRRPACNA